MTLQKATTLHTRLIFPFLYSKTNKQVELEREGDTNKALVFTRKEKHDKGLHTVEYH